MSNRGNPSDVSVSKTTYDQDPRTRAWRQCGRWHRSTHGGDWGGGEEKPPRVRTSTRGEQGGVARAEARLKSGKGSNWQITVKLISRIVCSGGISKRTPERGRQTDPEVHRRRENPGKMLRGRKRKGAHSSSKQFGPKRIRPRTLRGQGKNKPDKKETGHRELPR